MDIYSCFYFMHLRLLESVVRHDEKSFVVFPDKPLVAGSAVVVLLLESVDESPLEVIVFDGDTVPFGFESVGGVRPAGFFEFDAQGHAVERFENAKDDGLGGTSLGT